MRWFNSQKGIWASSALSGIGLMLITTGCGGGSSRHAAIEPSSTSVVTVPASSSSMPSPVPSESTVATSPGTTGSGGSGDGTSTPSGATHPGGSTSTNPRSSISQPTVGANQNCVPSQLSVTLTGNEGAAGTVIYAFSATNTGRQPCQIGGYFGVSLYDPAGHLLTAQDSRDPEAPGGKTMQAVQLNPGAPASFTVGVGDTPVGNQTSCPAIGAFHLIPPNATGDVQVSLAGNNHHYCGSQGVRITPTVNGT